jgi:fucose permease
VDLDGCGRSGTGNPEATEVLVVYWGSLLLGSLLAAQLLGFVRKTQLVMASAVGAVVGAVAILIGSPQDNNLVSWGRGWRW